MPGYAGEPGEKVAEKKCVSITCTFDEQLTN